LHDVCPADGSVIAPPLFQSVSKLECSHEIRLADGSVVAPFLSHSGSKVERSPEVCLADGSIVVNATKVTLAALASLA
jgi:hypothetical protein